MYKKKRPDAKNNASGPEILPWDGFELGSNQLAASQADESQQSNPEQNQAGRFRNSGCSKKIVRNRKHFATARLASGGVIVSRRLDMKRPRRKRPASDIGDEAISDAGSELE